MDRAVSKDNNEARTPIHTASADAKPLFKSSHVCIGSGCTLTHDLVDRTLQNDLAGLSTSTPLLVDNSTSTPLLVDNSTMLCSVREHRMRVPRATVQTLAPLVYAHMQRTHGADERVTVSSIGAVSRSCHDETQVLWRVVCDAECTFDVAYTVGRHFQWPTNQVPELGKTRILASGAIIGTPVDPGNAGGLLLQYLVPRLAGSASEPSLVLGYGERYMPTWTRRAHSFDKPTSIKCVADAVAKVARDSLASDERIDVASIHINVVHPSGFVPERPAPFDEYFANVQYTVVRLR
jgi:hypothetical protein